jgi:hypothetical protein
MVGVSMKFILSLLVLVSAHAFAQDSERCLYHQVESTLKQSKNICNEHVNEFAARSTATCKVLRYDVNVCWSECLDENRTKLAKVRVDMSSDCEREQVYYHRTVIKYYR